MMMRWNPTFGEFFKSRLEPKNEYNKFPVAVTQCNAVARHLSNRKTGLFAKTISIFLLGNNENSCYWEKRNLGDGEGLQIPRKLHFTGDAKYIVKLKHILPYDFAIYHTDIIINIYIYIFFFSHFFIIDRQKVELASRDRKIRSN